MYDKIKHIIWGDGEVLSHDDRYIIVSFDDAEVGTKTFVYPDAFEKYLKYENDELCAQMSELLSQRKLAEQQRILEEEQQKQQAARIEQQKKLAQSAKRRRALAYSRARAVKSKKEN